MARPAGHRLTDTFRAAAHRFGPRGSIELFLKNRGIWVLLAFALAYYAWYWRVWPGPGGEGGVVALISQRLLEGQRPIVDTFIGYNVLWFYPVVGLFKAFGPTYIGMRLFFFLLCVLTGLLSFRLILRCTGRAWVAFLAGVLVILIPGQTYRNYMAFLAVLNMTAFLHAYVLSTRSIAARLFWMAASGVTLGIACLVRVDVGYFLSFILLGLIVIFPWAGHLSLGIRRGILMAVAGLILGFAGFFLTHLPVYLDAQQRGFATQFAEQYLQWPRFISCYARITWKAASELAADRFTEWTRKPAPQPAAAVAAPLPVQAGTKVAGRAANSPAPAIKSIKITKGAQERRSITDAEARDKMMALNLYLPIPISLMLFMGALAGWLRAMKRSDEAAARTAWTLMTSLGCALVLFPQYFFWQPNMVHLSEFMVPMTLVIIMSCLVAAESWQRVRTVGRFFLALYLVTASVALVLYYVNACQSGGSGGIAVSQHKSVEFRGLNGVRVKMTPGEFQDADAICRTITAVSSPGEYVICYPYHPEINFMTDRPSYEYNLYADNDIPGDRFHREMMKNIGKFHPVVFVINIWDINGTEESRFYNWAAESYLYLLSNYRLAYKHGNFEVYVRPDRADRIPGKLRADEKTGPTP
jgi:hypothetical protein